LKKIDIYIIKKFLGTFFFSLILIVPVIIVFDLSEKMRDFIERKAPIKAIIVDYYFNFVPYLVNQFSPLFIFIAVIFFTSKMASNSEIVAILSGGISFKRLLRPFLLSAGVLAILSFYLNNFLIPDANKERLAFEEVYYRNKFRNNAHNIHLQIDSSTYIYMTSYNVDLNLGINFSIETFNDGELSYKLLSDNVRWDSVSNQWQISNYVERHIEGLNETINKGFKKDTILNFKPEEFKRRDNFIETKDFFALNKLIEEEKFKGSSFAVDCEIEKQKRMAYPFATFVLTIIGVSLSSRKVRGGIGLHIGLGLLISFSYILFMQVSATFAKNAGMPAIIAVWIPNVLYSILALYLLKKAPK
tara:strand:+ start:789 stop:1865 length:1077 start_codon:yes stop_codon:yes gene_type:complete